MSFCITVDCFVVTENTFRTFNITNKITAFTKGSANRISFIQILFAYPSAFIRISTIFSYSLSLAIHSVIIFSSGFGSYCHLVTITRGFLETLRMEHLNDGIHVMVFAPGYTTSNVRNAALLADGTPQGYSPKEEGKLMSAEEVAGKLADGLWLKRREMILTALGYWDVWFYKRFPRIMEKVQLYYIRQHEKQDDPFK